LGGFALPSAIDRITLVAALLLVVAAAGLVSGVAQLCRGRLARLWRVDGGAVCLACGLGLGLLAGWNQGFRVPSGGDLVATVDAKPVSGQPQTMRVTYTPSTGGIAGTPRSFVIQGDEWLLRADEIRWSDWLNILGVHVGFRISELSGSYDEAAGGAARATAVYGVAAADDAVSVFRRAPRPHAIRAGRFSDSSEDAPRRTI
jgi:hypothetical protein